MFLTGYSREDVLYLFEGWKRKNDCLGYEKNKVDTK